MSDSEHIIVRVTDFIPEENIPHILTQPFHIVKIQNTDLPIIFE